MKNLFVYLSAVGLLIGSACIDKAGARPPLVEEPAPPSPFAGRWAAVESDVNNAFSLHIRQEGRQLLAYYCAVQRRGQLVECGDSTDHFLTFIADCPNAATFETPFISYASGQTGHARLTLIDNALYWKVLEAPNGPCAVWKQACLIRELEN